MSRARAAMAAVAIAATWTCAADADPGPTRLALPMVAARSGPGTLGDARPGAPVLLAQRAIERRWGPAEDSLYRTIELPGWREEGFALVLSAAAPGAGQAYAGDRLTGIAFAAAEAVGWISHLFWRERGERLREEAEAYAGAPDDPESAWSFDRWTPSSDAEEAELRALYDGDRKVFYDLIGSDARLLSGWTGDPSATRRAYADLRGHAEARLRNARYAGIGLWMNHALAAAHALRAARLHNLPLQRDLELRLKSGWRDGPTVTASLERRF